MKSQVDTGLYVHEVPGRIRIRLPHLKGNGPAASCLVDRLREIEGVESACVNLTTGSLIVRCNPDKIDSNDIVPHVSADNASRMMKAKGEEKGRRFGSVVRGVVFQTIFGIVVEKSMYALFTVMIRNHYPSLALWHAVCSAFGRQRQRFVDIFTSPRSM